MSNEVKIDADELATLRHDEKSHAAARRHAEQRARRLTDRLEDAEERLEEATAETSDDSGYEVPDEIRSAIGYDAEVAAVRIMNRSPRQRTREALTDIVGDTLELFYRGRVAQEIIGLRVDLEGAERQIRVHHVEAERARDRSQTEREHATEELATLAESADAFAEAHKATLDVFSRRHVDRYVMRAADQRAKR